MMINCLKNSTMNEEFISKTKLLKIINSNPSSDANARCAQLLEAILTAPVEDVERVIRCKDCEFQSSDNFCFKGVSGLGYKLVSPEEFCCHGEQADKTLKEK